MNFYRLFYAKGDLAVDDVQWYWDGANKENIDQVIKEQFRKWLNEFELKK